MVKEKQPLGAVCVMDQRPRTLSSEQRRLLEILGEQVRNNLELRLSQLQMQKHHEEEISRLVVGSEEEERKRIGQELHDGVVQTLAAASMHLNIIRDPEQSSKDHESLLANLHEILDQAIHELRGMGHSLMGKEVRVKGLKGALETLAERYLPISKAPNIRVDVRIDNKELGQLEAINLYRVGQEFVQNSVKHSGASIVDLKVWKEKGLVKMLLQDDGSGLPEEMKVEESGGLANMKHRIRSLGGHYHLDTTPGAGLCVTVELDPSRNKEGNEEKGKD